MKKLMILPPIHAAMLLPVLFLASCGGGDDDDSPTAPAGDRLDSRLFGTWRSELPGYTFNDDGSGVSHIGGFDLVWWIENGQLVVAVPSVLAYSIGNGELTFTVVEEADNTDLHRTKFRADGNPSGLTGATWVSGGGELVFSSNGTYSWRYDGDDYDHESGSWIDDGGTLRISVSCGRFDYEVRGNTLTLSFLPVVVGPCGVLPGGVFSKQ